MNLLKFEWTKFLLNRKNIVMFVILSLLFILGSLQTDFQRQSVNELKKSLQDAARQNIVTDSNALSFADEKNLSQEERKKAQTDMDFENAKVDALEKNEINKYFDILYEQDKFHLNDKTQTSNDFIFSGDTPKNYKDEMAYIRLVKARGLDFELTAEHQYHAFGGLIYSFRQVFSSLWMIGFAIILSVNLANIFEKKEDRVYHAMNIPSARLIGANILTSISTAFVWLILLSGLLLVIFGFKNGFGSPNYPAYLVNQPSMAELMSPLAGRVTTTANMAISNGSVIIISLLYVPLIFFFITALGMFLSVLTKRSLVVITIIAILIQGYEYIKEEPWILSLRKFIPMSYLDPVNLLKYPNYLFGKNSLTFGVFYLAALGVILILLAQLMYRNYRIRRI